MVGVPSTARRRVGQAGLAAILASITCTLAVGVAGPSLMEPGLPGAPGQPPWILDLHLNPYAAVGLAGAGVLLGTVGLTLGMRAMRAGWTVSPRLLLLIGAGTVVVASQAGPFGSSDVLSYAAYGRELVTGHNPYVVTPETLARLGDPVARAVRDWAGTPSVYGPAANGVFGLASLIGGTSARLTVWVLDVVNAAAFLGTGLVLDRLAARHTDAARSRAALLWTCNPLLLQILVAGAHVDTLAVFFGVAALAVISSGSGALRAPLAGVLAGVLAGCGFAVKPTAALIVVGLIAVSGAMTPRIAIRPLLIGFISVVAADVALMGTAGVRDSLRASGMVSVGSPWRVVRAVLSLGMPEPAADDVVRWSAVACGVLLAVVLLRQARQSRRRILAWGAFACVLAWLFCWPYVLPWYDAFGWALLALLPASSLDWVLLARTAVLGMAYLPARSAGVTIPGGLRWMEPVFRSAVCPAVLAVLAVVLAAWAVRGFRSVAAAAR